MFLSIIFSMIYSTIQLELAKFGKSLKNISKSTIAGCKLDAHDNANQVLCDHVKNI